MGGRQRLIVGDHCKLGNVIHEIGHAVGFFHEMSRPDRDGYVEIIWKNIISGMDFITLDFLAQLQVYAERLAHCQSVYILML